MPDSRQWSVHTEHKLGWILMYSLVCLIFNASPLCEQPGAAGGSEDMKALHRQSSRQNKSSAHQKCSLNRQQAIKCRIRAMRSPELHICNTLHQYVYDCIKKKRNQVTKRSVRGPIDHYLLLLSDMWWVQGKSTVRMLLQKGINKTSLIRPNRGHE